MKRSVYKRVVSSLVTLSLLLLLAAPVLAATANERITSSVHVVRYMSKEDDVGAMADLVKSAKGVVIIPNYVKAALGIGGAHGEGLVLRRDPATNTWFGPSFLSVTGASIGFQI
ncbi:MAG: lipid-binding SYLF domain-containing protein, partial [Synergistales bacterium]|nr:lipid-binding SYLF domain-containing protein [Synergistales bacterium]